MNKSFFIKYKINTTEEESTVLVQAPHKKAARRLGLELIELIHSNSGPIILIEIESESKRDD